MAKFNRKLLRNLHIAKYKRLPYHAQEFVNMVDLVIDEDEFIEDIMKDYAEHVSDMPKAYYLSFYEDHKDFCLDVLTDECSDYDIVEYIKENGIDSLKVKAGEYGYYAFILKQLTDNKDLIKQDLALTHLMDCQEDEFDGQAIIDAMHDVTSKDCQLTTDIINVLKKHGLVK